MQEDLIFKHRNRLKKHFVNTSSVLLCGYKTLSDGAKQTYQVIDSLDWEDKETGESKGYVFPAIKTIAEMRSKGWRTIYRQIEELENAGLLTRMRRRNMPSILIIEDVSDNEANLYIEKFVNKGQRKFIKYGDKTEYSTNSTIVKNDNSQKAADLSKMTIAYKEKENELKENEINVNEDFKTFKNDGIKKLNRGQGTTSLRDILIQYKLDVPRKVKSKHNLQIKMNGIDKNQRDYLASEIADKLNDHKSLGCFRVIAEKVPQPVIFEVLSSIKETAGEGRIKTSKGALFVNIIQGYCDSHGIELGFNNSQKIAVNVNTSDYNSRIYR